DIKFKIVIMTHSTLCDGFLDASKLILGSKCEEVEVLPFEQNMSTQSLENQLEKLIEGTRPSPLLILTDLIGGTPNNIAMKFIEEPNIEVVSGINLPFLIEILMNQESGIYLNNIPLSDITTSSQESLIYINDMLEKRGSND